MAKSILGAFVALLAVFVTSAALSAEFKWVKPGGDACRKNPKCTSDFFLRNSGLSSERQAKIREAIKEGRHVVVMIKKGDVFDSMAFGARPGTERVVRNVVAAWEDGREETADVWFVDDVEGDIRYEFFVPRVCSNYALRTSKIPPASAEKVIAQVPRAPDVKPVPRMPPEPPPIVGCW